MIHLGETVPEGADELAYHISAGQWNDPTFHSAHCLHKDMCRICIGLFEFAQSTETKLAFILYLGDNTVRHRHATMLSRISLTLYSPHVWLTSSVADAGTLVLWTFVVFLLMLCTFGIGAASGELQPRHIQCKPSSPIQSCTTRHLKGLSRRVDTRV